MVQVLGFKVRRFPDQRAEVWARDQRTCQFPFCTEVSSFAKTCLVNSGLAPLPRSRGFSVEDSWCGFLEVRFLGLRFEGVSQKVLVSGGCAGTQEWVFIKV